MSSRAARVTITLLIVAVLLSVAYVAIPKVGMGHRKINTVGKIVFLSNADPQGVPHVWIVGQDGSGLKDLTPGSQICADPAFSPDGSQITYISDKQGSQQVFVMDADGLHPHAITFGSASKSSPQFSPDGKSLAFISQGTLTVIELQSNSTSPLLPTPTAPTSATGNAAIDLSHAAVLSYEWSPKPASDQDSDAAIVAVQELVGVAGIPDEDVLTLLPSVDSNPIVLIAAPSISFRWSPDGTKIYAAALGVNVGPQAPAFSGIVTYGADGKQAQTPALAASQSASIGPSDPEPSPDGKQMVFTVVNNPDLAHNTILGIYIQPLDGSAPPRPIIQGPATGLKWSPDSAKILVLLPKRGSSGHDLFAGPINSSSPPVNITKGSGDVTSAEWSPSQ